MQIIKKLKRKKLLRKLNLSTYDEMLNIVDKMSKKAFKEEQFNHSLIFAIFREDYTGYPEDIKTFNTKYLQKIAIIKKATSTYDKSVALDIYKDNTALAMAIYNETLDKCKKYKLIVRNSYSNDYLYILDRLLKEKEESYMILNGFIFSLIKYEYLGGTNNESIIECKLVQRR